MSSDDTNSMLTVEGINLIKFINNSIAEEALLINMDKDLMNATKDVPTFQSNQWAATLGGARLPRAVGLRSRQQPAQSPRKSK
jgi:hypothetical protein